MTTTLAHFLLTPRIDKRRRRQHSVLNRKHIARRFYRWQHNPDNFFSGTGHALRYTLEPSVHLVCELCIDI